LSLSCLEGAILFWLSCSYVVEVLEDALLADQDGHRVVGLEADEEALNFGIALLVGLRQLHTLDFAIEAAGGDHMIALLHVVALLCYSIATITMTSQ
jgi:hypothetical protein